MNHSAPSLHPPVLKTQAHKDLVGNKLSSIATERGRLRAQASRPAASPVSVSIPLTAVSLNSSFDAYINISYRGASPNLSVQLLVDSGNSALIVPNFSDIASLPDFSQNYTVLQYGVQEPWGCPACIVRGPIEILLPNDVHKIPNCEFYACLGPNESGQLTANFGVGRVDPWRAADGSGLQAALSYDNAYPYAEFAYAPAGQILAGGDSPNIAEGSLLTLYKTMPPGYLMFDIIKSLEWMSLRPQSLSIGTVKTDWPGDLSSKSIAMIDTGGGQVFLSDPKNYVWTKDWPNPAPVPDPSWLLGSYSCQAISGGLNITLSDGKNSFSYQIDPAKLPPSARGLSLTMCKQCFYMFGQNGMNIGGLCALFNYILIDYADAKVGFKAKPSEFV
jgi:hypothetical protein